MPKILLVEDDKSLREIYSIRLVAEGYDVSSAGDGEEALALAVQQKPDLILSDVMMPKISGFDMLDILRSTPETKDVKVIMMTALSSEDQRQRGENLGADKYLVKSQVGIEDVINAVKEALNGQSAVAPAESGGNMAQGATSPAAPVAPTQPMMGAVDMSKMGVSTTNVSPAATQPATPVATAVSATPAVPTAPTAPVAPATPATVEAPATQAAPANPVTPATPEPLPVDTGAAMDALVNETPDQPNATWPGNAAQ